MIGNLADTGHLIEAIPGADTRGTRRRVAIPGPPGSAGRRPLHLRRDRMNMTWQLWVLAAWFTLSMLINVNYAAQGKSIEMKPRNAWAHVVIWMALIALVVTA
jgi:hypothetical protein